MAILPWVLLAVALTLLGLVGAVADLQAGPLGLGLGGGLVAFGMGIFRQPDLTIEERLGGMFAADLPPAKQDGPPVSPDAAEPQTKTLPAALLKEEDPFAGRYFGAVNVESDHVAPLFMFGEEKDAQRELQRRQGLPEDDDDHLSEDWSILTLLDATPYSRQRVEEATPGTEEHTSAVTDYNTILGLALNARRQIHRRGQFQALHVPEVVQHPTLKGLAGGGFSGDASRKEGSNA